MIFSNGFWLNCSLAPGWLRFLNVPEENVSSDEELYTPFERCNMSAPPVLQDSHGSFPSCHAMAFVCCPELLVFPRSKGPCLCADRWFHGCLDALEFH